MTPYRQQGVQDIITSKVAGLAQGEGGGGGGVAWMVVGVEGSHIRASGGSHSCRLCSHSLPPQPSSNSPLFYRRDERQRGCQGAPMVLCMQLALLSLLLPLPRASVLAAS